MNDKFWIYNPEILITKYFDFIPTKDMDRVEQMNAVTRLFLYVFLLVFLFNRSSDVVIFLLMGIILIVVFFFISKSDKEGIERDLIKENKDEYEKFESGKKYLDNQEINKNVLEIFEEKKQPILKSQNPELEKNVEMQSGYIDFDGNYKIGKDRSDISLYELDKKEPKISLEKSKSIESKHCRKPTVENPYNNIVFSDFLQEGNVPQPCNSDQVDMTEMQNLYNSSLFRNLSDVFERDNSQRTFLSMPIQQYPSSQTDFANWLYKTGPTCHENSEYCTYYQDPSMTSQRY